MSIYRTGKVNSVSSEGGDSNTTTSWDDVDSVTVTITTTGRPVLLVLQSSNDSAVESCYRTTWTGATGGGGQLKLVRDSTDIAFYDFYLSDSDAAADFEIRIPVGTAHIDTPEAGTYVYKLQSRAVSGRTIAVRRVKLFAIEL